MANGVAFNFRKKRIIIKISENVEVKQLLITLKKKMPEIESLYGDDEPAIFVIGREFKEREKNEVRKFIGKYMDSEVKFCVTNQLGLYGIRKPFKKGIATSKSMFFNSSLRSGQKVEFEGSIIVLGDVNVGAEVIAGENIVVLGCIRGMAHAGAKGNKEAIITAESIEATQIRISNIVKECDKDELFEGLIKTNAYVDSRDEIVIE